MPRGLRAADHGHYIPATHNEENAFFRNALKQSRLMKEEEDNLRKALQYSEDDQKRVQTTDQTKIHALEHKVKYLEHRLEVQDLVHQLNVQDLEHKRMKQDMEHQQLIHDLRRQLNAQSIELSKAHAFARQHLPRTTGGMWVTAGLHEDHSLDGHHGDC